MTRRQTRKHSGKTHGFTLIEAMFAIMIIGIGIAALMTVFAAGTNVNAYGDRLSKGVFLADEIRAMTDNVKFTDLENYNGQVYNGVDANGSAVAGLQEYQQTISVRFINPVDMALYIATDPPPQGAIITALVSYNNEEITRLSWIRTP
jgi:prepilin-type N-terminal cleavage/methylation domain-containing protein